MVNVSNFQEFVEKINRDINEKYNNFSVNFAEERKKFTGNSYLVSPNQLFSLNQKHLQELYDYNKGGQKEVQYHIHKDDCIYYGTGFSFETSRSNPNPLETVKPFTDVFLDNNFKIYLENFFGKGYNFIHSNLNDFENPEIGEYYLFGKSIAINNDEISDEDYENMLNDFTTDLFELYKKIFEERNKLIENNKKKINNHENDLLNKCQELLESNYNLILTGAPGTGKTYLAKQIAAKMIFGEDKNLKDLNDDEKARFEYQYKFVQFHPSYDYTDFVEGIRPVTKNDDTYGFKRKDGTFKEFCKRAVYFNSIIPYLKEYCIDIDNTIKNGQQYITYDREDKEQSAKITNIIIKDNIISVQFSVDKGIKFTYNEFINMYINYLNIDVNDMVNDTNKITGKNFHHTYYYGFINTFHKKYKDKIFNSKLDNSKKDKYPFIFVIDEINRGDINKILGELFYAIDLGYRGEKGKVETQYQNLVESGDVFEKGFYIPENVYIIGTMNDIDRSVESMDFAIRRRFAWQEVKPEDTADEILKDVKINNAASVLNGFNKMIADKDALGEMYQIGASYFLKLNNYINDDKINDQESIKEAYQKLWDNHLKGLIHEYVRGKKSGEEIFDKIKNKYFDLTGINCKENNEDTAE